MKPLRIIFAGTPAFGLPCLEAIAHSPHMLQAIYTQPDRPAGRGRALQASAIKQWAINKQLPIYQPIHFKSKEDIDTLESLKPDVIVVIAYGLILPQSILDIPTFGCINVHASLLPQWRGAAPIQYAILNGDSETGVTIMQMDKGMDTGPMLLQASCPITKEDTAQSLQEKLSILAVEPLLTILNRLGEEVLQPTYQDPNHVSYAPKINKEQGKLAWSLPAEVLDQQIRAFNPWPSAFSQINDLIFKIHQAKVSNIKSPHPPGTILSIDKNGITVATGSHLLLIEKLQFPGSKVLSVKEWLNAQHKALSVGMVLE